MNYIEQVDRYANTLNQYKELNPNLSIERKDTVEFTEFKVTNKGFTKSIRFINDETLSIQETHQEGFTYS